MKNLTATLLAWGPLGVFLLAVLDAAGVPNPAGVDYLLLLVSWKKPDVAYVSAALGVVGSMLGSLFLYTVARRGGEKYLHRYTHRGHGAKFRRWFLHYGLVTVFIPGLVPMIPLPMKVFVLCSGAFGVSVYQFLGVLFVARVMRYFALAHLGRSLGPNAGAWLREHARDFAVLAVGLFIFLFLLVKFIDRRRRLKDDKLKSDHGHKP